MLNFGDVFLANKPGEHREKSMLCFCADPPNADRVHVHVVFEDHTHAIFMRDAFQSCIRGSYFAKLRGSDEFLALASMIRSFEAQSRARSHTPPAPVNRTRVIDLNEDEAWSRLT